MNALVPSSLSFQSMQFDVVNRNGQPWLRGLQIASALGFKNPSSDIVNLYERNASEFTPSMTALIELDTAGGKQQVRIFSLRGCHLLGMFARTKVAKEFRRWVLDVLDATVAPPPAASPFQDMVTVHVAALALTERLERLIAQAERLTAPVPAPETPEPYATIRAYAVAKNIKFDLVKAQNLGKKAVQIAQLQHKEVKKIPDDRYEYINAYPVAILDTVFALAA